MLFAYYQADTELVFAVGKTLNELEIDLMRNNNIKDRLKTVIIYKIESIQLGNDHDKKHC